MRITDWPQHLPLRPEWRRWAKDNGGQLPPSAERWYEENEPLLLRSLENYRNTSFANLITVIISIACSTHPEEIKKALEQVFDLSSVEFTARQTMAILQEVQKQATVTRQLLESIQKDIDDLELQLDGARFELEQRSTIPINTK